MPQRNTIRRVPTSKVQGDDSWVEVRAVTVGDMMRVFERQERQEKPAYKLGSLLARIAALFKRKARMPSKSDTYRAYCYGVIAQVSAWNWVDADGNPLPQPAQSPQVVEALTDPEVVCLIKIVYGTTEDATIKN
jgi:hypothetical protein